MDNYKFSVSICVYERDNPCFFREALDSIYNQTLVPDEVVLTVDGFVPDEINEIINEYVSKYKMRVVRLKRNMGHGNARRAGLEACSYNYVAIADADDVNRSDRFEKQINAFKANCNLSAVSSYCTHFCDTIDNIISYETLPLTNESIRKMMRTRCPLTQAAIMFKKDEVEAAGGYLDWYHAEDYYLWLRLYLNDAEFANIPENLVAVRSNKDQIIRRGGYKYYISLKKLYKFMYKNSIIGFGLYIFNVLSRFVVQVLFPTKLRAYVRKKLM